MPPDPPTDPPPTTGEELVEWIYRATDDVVSWLLRLTDEDGNENTVTLEYRRSTGQVGTELRGEQ
jgi:hypothetical protein